MSLISIDNGYQGDIEELIEKVRIVCLDPEMRDFLEKAVISAEMALKDKFPRLRKLQECYEFIDEATEDKHNIQPLKTKAIVINPKDDPRLYRQIRILEADPEKKIRVLNWLEAFGGINKRSSIASG